jgi:hypothetical protein
MISASIRKYLRKVLAWRTASVLDPDTATGELSTDEHRTIYALFQVITDDIAVPLFACRGFVDEKTRDTPGALDAYRQSARLLEESSRRHYGKRFPRLSMAERDHLLHWLFVAYPHEERLPAWARRMRLVPNKWSLLVEAGAHRLLRHHVMTELLSWYYTTDRGWAVVGWTEFPGRAREAV